MSLQIYWLAVPLVGLGLSLIGWAALWLTRPKPHAGSAHQPGE
jgi:hypothetical protein